jgi:predicted nucleic acid-binding protein
MLLHDILPGTHCFVDANIFYYHLVDTPPLSQECSEFFKRVRTKDLAASTSSAQIAEAMHNVMMAEAVAKHGFDRPGLAHRLQRRRELIAAFSDHEKVPAGTHRWHSCRAGHTCDTGNGSADIGQIPAADK